jgi:hypothetical protein
MKVKTSGVCLLRCKRGISRGHAWIIQRIHGLGDLIYS